MGGARIYLGLRLSGWRFRTRGALELLEGFLVVGSKLWGFWV